MIGLRVAHVLTNLKVSAAASAALNLMRWLRGHGHETVLFSGEGPRSVDVEAEELPWFSYSSKKAKWWLGGKRKLLADVREWRPDLIHVHQVQSLSHFCNVAVELGIQVVASLQTREPPIDLEHLRHPAVGLLTVPSESMRAQYVSRHGFSRDMVAVLPYGLDMERYPEVEPAARIETVGAIGRFAEEFGFDDLLSALVELRERGHVVRADLIGSGAGRERIEEAIAAGQLGDQVRIVEATPRTGDQLRELDLYVYPCHEDLLTLTVLKAMACSRPVVANAVGSMTEWIRDGSNGILVPPQEPAALAEALTRCREEAGLAAGLGGNGRAYVAEHHGLDIVGEVAHSLYRNVLRAGVDPASRADSVNAYRKASATLPQPDAD